jgi:hypothetical protein
MDVRRFFSTGIDVRGNLPQSLLRNTHSEVATGIVQADLNVPYSQLLGQDSGEPSYSNEGRSSFRSEAKEGARLFRHVPAAIKTILQGVHTKYPSMTMAELMAAHHPPLLYCQVLARMAPAWTTCAWVPVRTASAPTSTRPQQQSPRHGPSRNRCPQARSRIHGL